MLNTAEGKWEVRYIDIDSTNSIPETRKTERKQEPKFKPFELKPKVYQDHKRYLESYMKVKFLPCSLSNSLLIIF